MYNLVKFSRGIFSIQANCVYVQTVWRCKDYNQIMAKVESFNLDHTKVRAPYVRVAGKHLTPNGDTITKFDLRLAQPNQEFLGTGTMHTLEHLLAGNLRDHLTGIIDISPMGCRTGFYMVMDGEQNPETVKVALEKTLAFVRDFDQVIPGVSELECGNYRDHNLQNAKDWAKKVLTQGLIVQETVRIPDGVSSQ
jgi:S-ribosylhomocysteine lyase